MRPRDPSIRRGRVVLNIFGPPRGDAMLPAIPPRRGSIRFVAAAGHRR